MIQGAFHELSSGSQASGHGVGHGMFWQFARIPWWAFVLRIYRYNIYIYMYINIYIYVCIICWFFHLLIQWYLCNVGSRLVCNYSDLVDWQWVSTIVSSFCFPGVICFFQFIYFCFPIVFLFLRKVMFHVISLKILTNNVIWFSFHIVLVFFCFLICLLIEIHWSQIVCLLCGSSIGSSFFFWGETVHN